MTLLRLLLGMEPPFADTALAQDSQRIAALNQSKAMLTKKSAERLQQTADRIIKELEAENG